MLWLISMGAVLPLIAFWAWMFRDMARNEALSLDERSKWLGAFVLLNVFGAALYYTTRYNQKP